MSERVPLHLRQRKYRHEAERDTTKQPRHRNKPPQILHDAPRHAPVKAPINEIELNSGADESKWEGSKLFIIVPKRDIDMARKAFESCMGEFKPSIFEYTFTVDDQPFTAIGVSNVERHDRSTWLQAIKKHSIPYCVECSAGITDESLRRNIDKLKPQLLSSELFSRIKPALESLTKLSTELVLKNTPPDGCSFYVALNRENNVEIDGIPSKVVLHQIARALQDAGLRPSADFIKNLDRYRIIINGETIMRDQAALVDKLDKITQQVHQGGHSPG